MTWWVAVEPPVSACERIALMQEDVEAGIRQLGLDPRWVSAEQLRAVLELWPQLDEGQVSRIREGLRVIARTTPPLPVEWHGAELFPGPRTPRQLVAQVSGGPELEGLCGRVSGLGQGLAVGSLPGGRPQLALGRFSAPSDFYDIAPVVARYGEVSWGRGPVRELLLLRSSPTERHGRAQLVDRFELGTGR